MHDCCIIVTALLGCLEWILNKPHNKTGDMASNHAINTKWLWVNFWCYKLLL